MHCDWSIEKKLDSENSSDKEFNRLLSCHASGNCWRGEDFSFERRIEKKTEVVKIWDFRWTWKRVEKSYGFSFLNIFTHALYVPLSCANWSSRGLTIMVSRMGLHRGVERVREVRTTRRDSFLLTFSSLSSLWFHMTTVTRVTTIARKKNND